MDPNWVCRDFAESVEEASKDKESKKGEEKEGAPAPAPKVDETKPDEKKELPTCFWLFLKNTFWDVVIPIEIPNSDVPGGDDILTEAAGTAETYQVSLKKTPQRAWKDTRGLGKTSRKTLRDGILKKASRAGKFANSLFLLGINFSIYKNLYEEYEAYEEGRCRAIGSNSHN